MSKVCFDQRKTDYFTQLPCSAKKHCFPNWTYLKRDDTKSIPSSYSYIHYHSRIPMSNFS